MNVILERTIELIAKHGWAVQYVMPDATTPEGERYAFHYTAGLAAFGLPELIMYALPQDVGHRIMNDLAGRVVNGRSPYQHGEKLDDVIVGHPVCIIDCDPAATNRAPVFVAERVAEELAADLPFRVQQVVYPDRQGRFPWDDDYDIGMELPLHGEAP